MTRNEFLNEHSSIRNHEDYFTQSPNEFSTIKRPIEPEFLVCETIIEANNDYDKDQVLWQNQDDQTQNSCQVQVP